MRSILAVPALALTASLAAASTSGAQKTPAGSRRAVHATLVTVPLVTTVVVRGTVDGSAIVHSARHYIGVPYRLGGTTPAAFDCSGFVRYVFALHGIALPRTAHEQAAFGDSPAPGDSLEPGDLLFFYGGQGAQHIAMYVGGDTIIHASSVGHHVRLDLLSGAHAGRRSWFNQRLIAVRRILPLEGLVYVTSPVQPGTSASPTFSLLPNTAREW
jgi:cell wall-associated NlpC family hydrolase